MYIYILHQLHNLNLKIHKTVSYNIIHKVFLSKIYRHFLFKDYCAIVSWTIVET